MDTLTNDLHSTLDKRRYCRKYCHQCLPVVPACYRQTNCSTPLVRKFTNMTKTEQEKIVLVKRLLTNAYEAIEREFDTVMDKYFYHATQSPDVIRGTISEQKIQKRRRPRT